MSFLSTLSLRRATSAPSITPTASRNFYPRSPCGERRFSLSWLVYIFRDFYPRSPCGERRSFLEFKVTEEKAFLSTLSLRRATFHNNPNSYLPLKFLSTLSLRRATGKSTTLTRIAWISIHALLAESDVRVVEPGLVNKLFLSTLSLRRATPLR